MQVKCVEFSLAIVYIVLVTAFFGWGLLHRTRERKGPSPRMKPLLNVKDEGGHSVNKQEDESHPMQVHSLCL